VSEKNKMVETGIKGHQETIVTEANIAANVGSGKVTVFATPMMVALIEKAALLSVEPVLSEGQTTVGTKLDVTHSSPTPIGMKVWAETEVIEVDRRRIVFSVKAFDEAGLIGEGTHERFIINLTDFQKKAELKTKRQ